MKRFLIKVSVFLIGLVMFDFMVGMCCRYLVNHAKGGDTGLNNYICHKMTEEFLIFGSSRGMHHHRQSEYVLLELRSGRQRNHSDVWSLPHVECQVCA